MQTVKEAVVSLSESFETKSSDMERKLSAMTDRLGRLEVAASRPLAEISPLAQEQKTSFRTFVAKGEVEEKAMSSQGDEGGYLIPGVINHSIHNLIQAESAMRQLASSLSISSDAVDLLVSQDTADAGWAGEADERLEKTAPKLTKIKIPVHEMYTRLRATQKLLDDASIDIEEWLSGRIGAEMARLENHAFIHGTGDKQPKGFLTYPLNQGNYEWGKLEARNTGAAGAFPETNAIDVLIDTVSSLKPQYLPGAKWLMSRSAAAAISKLKDKNGVALWNTDLNHKAHATLLGYPVVISDDMPAISEDKPAIAFGNFSEGYKIIDRQNTHMMRDPYSAKPYVEFYTTRRVGGDVVNFEAIKVIKFTA